MTESSLTFIGVAMHKLLFGFLMLGTLVIGQDAQLKPIEDALWKGVLLLEVTGPCYSQYNANQPIETGGVEYVKEKGQMNVALKFEVQFVINAVGEYELLGLEEFRGDYALNWQGRRQYTEEVKDKGIKYNRKVQVSLSRDTVVLFEDNRQYERENMTVGNLRVVPSGRLAKKGSLQMSGELSFDYEGQGTFTETLERQPADPKKPNTRKKGEVSKPFNIPVSFDIKVALRGKPVSGTIVVTGDVKNPFPKSEGTIGTASFRSALTMKGTYQLTPLFGKKK